MERREGGVFKVTIQHNVAIPQTIPRKRFHLFQDVPLRVAEVVPMVLGMVIDLSSKP